MRIEAYAQVAQLYKSNGTSKAQPTAGVAAAKDEVQISSFGRDYQIARKAVSEADDIREDRVSDVKSRIASGRYDVDTGDFAAMLLAKYERGL